MAMFSKWREIRLGLATIIWESSGFKQAVVRPTCQHFPNIRGGFEEIRWMAVHDVVYLEVMNAEFSQL